MRKVLPVIVLLFLLSCKKGGDTSPPSIFFDSSKSMYGVDYLLDINTDKIPDLKFGWYGFLDPAGPNNYTYKTSYIVALHNQVSIHATKQFAQLCKDTSYPYGPWPFTKIYNCTGGPKYFRTDTFVATPNLDSLSLVSTPINKMTDSVIIYKQFNHWESYSYDETVNHGFFVNASSGFLLFKLGQKRYALRLKQRGNYLPLIEKLVQIDL